MAEKTVSFDTTLHGTPLQVSASWDGKTSEDGYRNVRCKLILDNNPRPGPGGGLRVVNLSWKAGIVVEEEWKREVFRLLEWQD